MIHGVKILTLLKQHYLDEYKKDLDCAYSCWGYYDGIDIVDVRPTESRLFQKKSNSAISDIWYQIAQKVSGLDGRVSQQNIGLFRKESGEEKFWEDSSRKIFLTVCFLQLKECDKRVEIAEQIEQDNCSEINILTYFTFDNADLVVFLQSNSYQQILDKIKSWENGGDVLYIHSVCGVLEKALREAALNGGVIEDASGNSLVNDTVDELQIEIVAAKKGFDKRLKQDFHKWNEKFPLKNYEHMEYYHRAGHANYTFSWKDTDMQSVLYLLLPKGIGTHLNGLFGEYIYNMETKVNLEKECFLTISENEVYDSRSKLDVTNWCEHEIETYKKYMANALKVHDEGLYAYCKAMIQTINMLAQYENFQLSNKIFYMIYPAFRLFSKQLANVESQNSDKVKKAIKEFSESVNSIVYHSVHTDQIFLMIPGYSGTSFSIPTKLSLFYLWYLDKISEILNDEEYEYQFFLTPVMETSPFTSTIDFGLPVGSRLIAARVSQRSLYIPKALMLILSHETAHYVGNTFRNRKLRLEYVVRTLGFIIADGIFPHYMVETEAEKEKKKEVVTYVNGRIASYMNPFLRTSKVSEKYHASQVQELLKRACSDVLADENSELDSILRREEDTTGSFDERVERKEKIDRKAEECKNKRVQMLGSSVCEDVVNKLLKLYRESFADIVAKTILEFTKEDYDMAVDISDGMKGNKNAGEERLRGKVILGKTQGRAPYPSDENSEKRLEEYWMNLDCVEIYLLKYAKQCQQDLECYFKESENRMKNIEEIRETMRLFSSNTATWETIYGAVLEKAEEYSKKVERIYREKENEKC